MFCVTFRESVARVLLGMEPHTAQMVYRWIFGNLHESRHPYHLGRPVSRRRTEYHVFAVGPYRVYASVLTREIRIVFIQMRTRRFR